MNWVLGNAGTGSLFWVHARMAIPVMIASAFVNNTPIVALMMWVLWGLWGLAMMLVLLGAGGRWHLSLRPDHIHTN